jgi:hypothetical protein
MIVISKGRSQPGSGRVKQAQRELNDKQNEPLLRKLFFDSSNAPCATVSKLIPKAFGIRTVETVIASVRKEL